MEDLELKTISQCYEALKEVDDDSKKRIIQWLVSKFNLTRTDINATQLSSNIIPEHTVVDAIAIKNSNETSIESYKTVADFFGVIIPNNDWEKALAVATYLQITKELTDFSGYDVNKELKNLGHGTSNITGLLDVAINRKPQLILQLRKEGNSRQAQKKYKVSSEGIKYIKALLQNVLNAGS